MKITPLEIRQHEFEKTFRGYNIEEVDNFLANLSQEWERILNESKMLRMQLEMAEKEASKLREIEMTLFKTLKTAEDTSTMITEQANQQADKYLQESKQKSEQIVQEAEEKAREIIREAETKAKYIKEEVLGEVKLLERDFKDMDQYKNNLLVQMRSLSMATLEHVKRFEEKFNKEEFEEKFSEASAILSDKETLEAEELETPNVPQTEAIVEEIQEETEEIVEEVPEVVEETETPEIEEPITEEAEKEEEEEPEELPSANDIIEEGPQEEEQEPEEDEQAIVEESVAEEELVEKAPVEERKTEDLSIIEGIGPKIAMLLYDSGIFNFKDLASTPVARIREILENAGPAYAMHDPSTWVEQALLAAEGRFEELDEMKERLIGGRAVEDVEEKAIDNSVGFFDSIGETETEEVAEEPVAEIETPKVEPPKTAQENNIESITEEMLEKVNKVKAAIRKAMVEKADSPAKDNTPLPTVNDIIGKSNESNSGGGSFFDNI